ncbi:MAG: galactokinase [Deltaproteobacteria bacterium]|nr:galactokinase [Deltaproteobacteria bacterium]
MSIFSSTRKILKNSRVEASAPCRVDSGGTWDIRSMALPMEAIEPVTVNIALSLRTRVELLPFEEGMVKVSSEGFPDTGAREFKTLPFDSTFGLFYAAISYFGFHSLEVRIASDSPSKAALGGSSTALVALIKALSKLAVLTGKPPLPQKDILHLAYYLEDSTSSGKCGIQDQAAAVFGGVNLWRWHFGNRQAPYERTPLLDRKRQQDLSEHLLVAFSGRSHVSARINQGWLEGFLSGRTRAGWIEANRIVRRLAQALIDRKWDQAAGLLREEMAVRREITPDALIPVTDKLIRQAELEGCGARFAGAGAGGSVWALGEKKRIDELKTIWRSTLAPIRGAGILDCAVDPRGVR